MRFLEKLVSNVWKVGENNIFTVIFNRSKNFDFYLNVQSKMFLPLLPSRRSTEGDFFVIGRF